MSQLPPLPPGTIEGFKKRARDALSAAKETFDWDALLFLRELKKQKYAERWKKGANAKSWWEGNLEDLCPYGEANASVKLAREFTEPSARQNFLEFSSTNLELALRYCKANGIDVPHDPRELTIQFVDEAGRSQTKPFAQCGYVDLVLAVHGKKKPDSKAPARKLEKEQQAVLDACRQSIAGFTTNPERRVIAEWVGDMLHYSLVKIPEGVFENALESMWQAVHALDVHPRDDS